MLDINTAKTKARPSVLIVEDDPFIAIDLEDAFLDAGYRVLGPCATVEDALCAARSERPDIATLDFDLMDSTSRRVAELLSELDVPFLLVTSMRREALEAPCFKNRECFAKPFDADKLVSRTGELVAA